MRRFARTISIIVIAALLAQYAEPLLVPFSASFRVRAAHASAIELMDWDKMEKDFRDAFADEYYGKPYNELNYLQQQRVDNDAREQVNIIKKKMQEIEQDPHKDRADGDNADDARRGAKEAYEESDIKDLFKSLTEEAGEMFPDMFKKILDNLTGLPISSLLEMDPDGLIEFIEDKLVDKLEEKFSQLGYIADLIKIIIFTETDRLKNWTCAQLIELPVILAAGLLMIAACIPAVIAGQALAEKAYMAEAIVLAGIAILDFALFGTMTAIVLLQNDWDKEIREDYEDDHKTLGGGTFRDLLGKLVQMRGTLSITGISFPIGDIASKFGEVNPGYRSASIGLYIEDYKKIAENWKRYAAAHAQSAAIEANDYSILKGTTIPALTSDSLNKGKGYIQAIEARAQTYAFAAQQTTNLRHDIARQVDIRARQALDRQQRRADLHAAFGRAAKGGPSWSTGTDY